MINLRLQLVVKCAKSSIGQVVANSWGLRSSNIGLNKVKKWDNGIEFEFYLISNSNSVDKEIEKFLSDISMSKKTFYTKKRLVGNAKSFSSNEILEFLANN